MVKKTVGKPFRFKDHVTERIRGQNLIVEKWTNAKCAFIGYRTGQGWTSVAIAKELNDGTSPETIRHLWKIWQLPYNGAEALVAVPLSVSSRALLIKRAEKEGLSPETWCRLILEFAAKDDMFKAITGD